MESRTPFIYSAIAIILAVTLLAGPIGFLDVPTADKPTATPTTGNATVEIVSTPDTLTIRPADTGQNLYMLEIQPATVTVSNLIKNPILVYKLSIDGIGYTKNSVTPLEPSGEGTLDIQITRSQFMSNRISSDSYVGELSLILRGDEEFVLLNKNVTVQVES